MTDNQYQTVTVTLGDGIEKEREQKKNFRKRHL